MIHGWTELPRKEPEMGGRPPISGSFRGSSVQPWIIGTDRYTETHHLLRKERRVRWNPFSGPLPPSLRANVMWNTCLGQFRVQVGHAHERIAEQFYEWIRGFLLRGCHGGSP